MRYVRQETVHAPAERVWNLLTDVEGWPAWTESMRQIQRLDNGPFAVGSRSRVVQPTGRPMQWTVTELEPLRNFTWTAGQPGMSFAAAHHQTAASRVPGCSLAAMRRTRRPRRRSAGTYAASCAPSPPARR
jgi:uncharacterized protein YndB with AHSA1/START domain